MRDISIIADQIIKMLAPLKDLEKRAILTFVQEDELANLIVRDKDSIEKDALEKIEKQAKVIEAAKACERFMPKNGVRGGQCNLLRDALKELGE